MLQVSIEDPGWAYCHCRFQAALPDNVRALPTHPDTDPFLIGVIDRDTDAEGDLEHVALSERDTNSILSGIDTLFVTESVRLCSCPSSHRLSRP
jgi:hypothetical protein